LTPLNDDLEPDQSRFVDHCRWLLNHGCDGLAPFGTTGEGASLAAHHKIGMLQAAQDADLPMNRMISGTGTCVLSDAVEIARVATVLGCEGVLCIPPFYYKSPDESGIYRFYSELIQRVGDNKLRIFLYHFPRMSAVPVSFDLISRLLKEYPDVVVGLKDSSGDWSNTKSLLESFPGFSVFSGSEQFLFQNLQAGGAGCISASTNVTAVLAHNVYENWLRGDLDSAKKLQTQLSDTRMALDSYPMIPALKALKSAAAGEPDWLNMLPPLEQLPISVRNDLIESFGHLIRK
jgi:4-hydroxy-tetrahydrodipicolinate synthase